MQDPVLGHSLGAVGGDGIAVVVVLIASVGEVEMEFTALLEGDRGAVAIDAGHGSEIAARKAKLAVVPVPADAVAGLEFAPCWLEHVELAAVDPACVEGERLPFFGAKGQAIVTGVDGADDGVVAAIQATAFKVKGFGGTDDLANLVGNGGLFVGVGQAGVEEACSRRCWAGELALHLQQGADGVFDRFAALAAGFDEDGVGSGFRGKCGIVLGHHHEAGPGVTFFDDTSSVAFQRLERCRCVAGDHCPDGGATGFGLLPDDLGQAEGVEAAFLGLSEGLAGFDAAELDLVAGEDDAGSLLPSGLEEFNRFPRAEQTHLVDDPDFPAAGEAVYQSGRGTVLGEFAEEAMHGLAFGSEGVAKRLGGGSRRSESAHCVAFGLGGRGDGGEDCRGLGGAGGTLQQHDAVARCEDAVGGGTLVFIPSVTACF